jgi:hypothetical protein
MAVPTLLYRCENWPVLKQRERINFDSREEIIEVSGRLCIIWAYNKRNQLNIQFQFKYWRLLMKQPQQVLEMNYRLHAFPHYCINALWTGEER